MRFDELGSHGCGVSFLLSELPGLGRGRILACLLPLSEDGREEFVQTSYVTDPAVLTS